MSILTPIVEQGERRPHQEQRSSANSGAMRTPATSEAMAAAIETGQRPHDCVNAEQGEQCKRLTFAVPQVQRVGTA